MEKKTIEQLKADVTNSFPSLFSREDVITILNQVAESEEKKTSCLPIDLDWLIVMVEEAVYYAIDNNDSDIETEIENVKFDIENCNTIVIDTYDAFHNLSEFKGNVLTEVKESLLSVIREKIKQDAQVNNV